MSDLLQTIWLLALQPLFVLIGVWTSLNWIDRKLGKPIERFGIRLAQRIEPAE